MKAKTTKTPAGGFRSRLITLAVGGGAVAYALLVFVPGQKAIQSVRDDIKTKRQEIVQSELLAKPIADLQESIRLAHTMVEKWQHRAPRANSLSPIYAEVIRHAKDTHIEITSFTPQVEQSLETIGLVPVSLQMQGSYHSIHDFLGRLEQLRGVVWVDDASFELSSPQARLEGTVKLIIFANRGEISG